MKIRCCQCYKHNEEGKLVIDTLDISIIAEIRYENKELTDLIAELNSFAIMPEKGKIVVSSFGESTFINGSIIVKPMCQGLVDEIATHLNQI